MNAFVRWIKQLVYLSVLLCY